MTKQWGQLTKFIDWTVDLKLLPRWTQNGIILKLIALC